MLQPGRGHAILQAGAPAPVPLKREDQPQIVLDGGGSLLMAWKPAKFSMQRQVGGGLSEMEAEPAIDPGISCSAQLRKDPYSNT